MNHADHDSQRRYVQFTIRLTKDEYGLVSELKNRLGIQRSGLVRLAIRRFAQREGLLPEPPQFRNGIEKIAMPERRPADAVQQMLDLAEKTRSHFAA